VCVAAAAAILVPLIVSIRMWGRASARPPSTG
jgi:hypothetical protein